jgi:hypothetical protein
MEVARFVKIPKVFACGRLSRAEGCRRGGRKVVVGSASTGAMPGVADGTESIRIHGSTIDERLGDEARGSRGGGRRGKRGETA